MRYSPFSHMLLVGASLITTFACARNPYQVEIKLSGNGHFLQGEPGMALVIIRNVSGQPQDHQGDTGLLYMNGKRCGIAREAPMSAALAQPGQKVPVVIDPPNWEKRQPVNLTSWCELKEPGTYDLEYRYPVSGKLAGSSNVLVHVIVEAPQGMDLQAHNAMNACSEENKMRTDSGPYCENEILIKKFPESKYAAHALIHVYAPAPFIPSPKDDNIVLALINHSDTGLSTQEKRPIGLGDDEASKKQRELMASVSSGGEKFATAHPDHPSAGFILARSGFNALLLGDFSHACKMLDKSLTLKWELPESYHWDTDAQPQRQGTEHYMALLKEKNQCK